MVILYLGSRLFNDFLMIFSTSIISLLGIFCSKSFKYLKRLMTNVMYYKSVKNK